ENFLFSLFYNTLYSFINSLILSIHLRPLHPPVVAPHFCETSSTVFAPSLIHSLIVCLLTPLHKQTFVNLSFIISFLSILNTSKILYFISNIFQCIISFMVFCIFHRDNNMSKYFKDEISYKKYIFWYLSLS